MRRKTMKFWIGILLAGILCVGCSKTGIGGNPELLKEDSGEDLTQKDTEGDSEQTDSAKKNSEDKKRKPYFNTDRTAVMAAVRNSGIEVEDDEKYGDYPECMESCRAKSGLFHMDVFDNREEYKEKCDGTYMIQIIYYIDRLQTEEGKKEALQLLEEVCGQLDVVYEEDTLWGYIEEILVDKGKWTKFRENEYKENAHIRITKEAEDTEVNIRITVPGK